MSLEDIKQVKLEKLELLKKAGVDPYPAKSWRTHEIKQALENFEKLSEEKERIVLVGRVMAKREHGASVFLDIQDTSAQTQVYFKKDVIGDYDYELFSKTVDIGDFIEVSGFLFKTKKEEKTLEVEKYRMLAKSFLPLPEKWHGLQDIEERFRKRYLDLIFNPEVKEKFEMRSKIVQTLRDFMVGNEFMEVVTPTLQPLYGGASARPFKTHMHDLDIDLYLRIAPELYLKRLLVGGFEKVFEFTTNFRNEGMDRDHNPEFSVLEFYAAYKDLDWLMNFTEEIFENLLVQVFGQVKIKYEDKEIDFARPFKRARFNDLLKKYCDLDYETNSEDEFWNKAEKLNVKIEKKVAKPGLADELFKKVVRPKLLEPIFVTDWPADVLPLAKKIYNSDFVNAFQFFAGGNELIKAFQELNDPLDQRARFEVQENRRAKGEEEAQRMDEDFIEALEYGMPPAAGWGLGIDRLIAMLTDSHSVREVILFPLMKPR
ncbi:MAG: lysine--tRNA ligase [Candidatus Yanofskybacteria bacterium]|nr:lysine--tRNA ligase [Candidatus Yanofskybacteria bacterium]